MSLLADLLALKGLGPADVAKNSGLGRFFASEPVKAGPHFERIIKLERRAWTEDPRVTDYLSKKLRRPGSTQVLFPWQAWALGELHDHPGGVFTVADLGAGKTHVSALAPGLLGSQRGVFFNYQRLMDKTRREFDAINKDWEVFQNYEFLSVEKFSRENYADYLEKLSPDFICVDESQSFSNPDGPRFRRLERYYQSHPGATVLFLTATPGTDSIRQFAHLQRLVHGSDCPLPDGYELIQWCEALDAEVRGPRRPPGVLTRFSDGHDGLEEVQKGIGALIAESHGNVYFRQANGVPCSLYADVVKFDDVSTLMDEYVSSALRAGTLPDGRCFEEVYDTSLIVKQLGCGYVKALNPLPPEDWRAARSLANRFVNEVIGQGELDTPAQVTKKIRSGELDDYGIWRAWKEIEPSFTPTHTTEWFDLSVVEYCSRRLVSENLIVWVTLPTFGRKLAEVSGCPFFHANGIDPVHGSIETYKGGPAVLAVRPNCLGRNLQDRWSKALYVCPPGSATELDQSIGRLARTGQRAPCVDVTFVLTVRENWNCLQKARQRALVDRNLGKNEASRLLVGDWCLPDLAEVSGWKGPRWAR